MLIDSAGGSTRESTASPRLPRERTGLQTASHFRPIAMKIELLCLLLLGLAPTFAASTFSDHNMELPQHSITHASSSHRLVGRRHGARQRAHRSVRQRSDLQCRLHRITIVCRYLLEWTVCVQRRYVVPECWHRLELREVRHPFSARRRQHKQQLESAWRCGPYRTSGRGNDK